MSDKLKKQLGYSNLFADYGTNIEEAIDKTTQGITSRAEAMIAIRIVLNTYINAIVESGMLKEEEE